MLLSALPDIGNTLNNQMNSFDALQFYLEREQEVCSACGLCTHADSANLKMSLAVA